MVSYTDSWLPLPVEEYQAIQNSLIQYAYNDAGSYFVQLFFFLGAILTFVANLLVMAVILRSTNIRDSNSGILTFQMAFVEFSRAVIGISTSITFLIKGQLTTSVETCFLAALFASMSVGTWLITFALSAFDRYMTIVRQRAITKFQLGLLLSLVWIMTIIFSILPIIAQHHSYYKVRMSGLYSGLSYYDHSETGIILSVASLVYLGLPNQAISSCYSAIIKSYVSLRIQTGKFTIDGKDITDPSKLTLWQTYKLIKDMGQNSNMTYGIRSNTKLTEDALSAQSEKSVVDNATQLSNRQHMELLVFRKSVATFIAFNICWLPLTITSLYELISGHPVPRLVDTLAVLCVNFSGLATGYLNFILDERFKTALNELLNNKN